MLINIIHIGNSKGIRIPKSILEQCHIENKVDMEIEDDKIILKPIVRNPRRNWAEKFKQMHKNKDDELIIDDSIDVDMDDWEW
jgi:antitoxin MazE